MPLLGEAEEPGSARLLLPVHSGRVDHVVVLENRLLELALRCEHFLRTDGQRSGAEDTDEDIKDWRYKSAHTDKT